VPAEPPQFSPFPFERLPRVSREGAARQSALARQLAARPTGARLAKLLGAVRIVRIGEAFARFEPHGAIAEVRVGGTSIAVVASGMRAIAQKLFGGPDELAAPRPATPAEHAALALVLATALADAGASAEVWPLSDAAREVVTRELVAAARLSKQALDERELIGRGGLISDEEPATVAGSRRSRETPAAHMPTQVAPIGDRATRDPIGIEVVAEVGGSLLTVVAWCPAALVFQAPPVRSPPGWTFDLPVVVARCALPRETLHGLAVRDVVVVERDLMLVIGDGGVRLGAAPGAVEATVTTGYVRADMALPDDAHLELTVQLGTTRLSLRRIGELAVGEVIGLGRPLAGPYEIHAGGRRIGTGELVDLDGEIGVRIVSLTQE
jgi:hypothetical protein